MKFVFVFLTLVVVMGVGILVLGPYENPEQEPRDITPRAEPQEEAPSEPSEQIIRSIIRQILGPQFQAESATYALGDLDDKEGKELIIGASEGTSAVLQGPATATIHVVKLTDSQGGYERIGSIQYTEMLWGPPEVTELRDVNGDGAKEIFAELMYGGAASFAQGLLEVHTGARELNWATLQEKSGQQRDAIFISAASAMHWNALAFTDIDKDGQGEIAEIFAQRDAFNPDTIECAVSISEWNGQLFAYSEQLSQEALAQLSPACEL